MDEKAFAERLLDGEHLPPDIPRELALKAFRLALRLRKERGCCICGYPEAVTIRGKRFCKWHKPWKDTK